MTTPDLDHLLGDLWPGVTVGAPSVLTGGFWARMWRVPVRGQPSGVADEVVVRLAPSRDMGAKEAEVQRAAAAQGFPTPMVWHSAADPGSDGWWSVMDFAPGRPLLAGLDGVTALRRAPSLVRTLPARLADAMAALHRLDPAPVTAAVGAAGIDVAWSVYEMLDHLRDGAKAVERRDVIAALDRLAVTLPPPARNVLCHGDLHPFNVLDLDGETVVLDWTGSVVADPCFDVAFTELLLSDPPIALPSPLAVVGRAAGRVLARRLVARYRRANPEVSLDALDWHRALHSARVVVEATGQRLAGNPDHPFLHLQRTATRVLADFAGVDVVSGGGPST